MLDWWFYIKLSFKPENLYKSQTEKIRIKKIWK